MLVDLLHKSFSLILENPKASMTKHVGAVGLRFRFLYLALYLVQSDYLPNGVSKYLLREKIYHTAFDYFTVRHHCPTQTHDELRSDIRTLIRFFSLVHGEKKFCNDSPITGRRRFRTIERRFDASIVFRNRQWNPERSECR